MHLNKKINDAALKSFTEIHQICLEATLKSERYSRNASDNLGECNRSW